MTTLSERSAIADGLALMPVAEVRCEDESDKSLGNREGAGVQPSSAPSSKMALPCQMESIRQLVETRVLTMFLCLQRKADAIEIECEKEDVIHNTRDSGLD